MILSDTNYEFSIKLPTDESGATKAIPATLDNGYYSEAAVQVLET
jgi:hypothetical protein